MTRVRVTSDEWYPVYEVGTERDTYAPWVDVPDEVIERVSAAKEEFQAVQRVLKELHDAAWEARKPGDPGWFDTRDASAPRGLV